MRAVVLVAALGLTAACAPEIPESGAGFDTSFDDALAQDAAIAGARTGAAVPPPKVVSTETLAAADTAPLAPPVVAAAVPPQPQPLPAPVSRAVTTQTETAEDIANETAAALQAAARNSGVAPVEASPNNPPPQQYSNPGISDENDFQAVSSRESIDSDAARLKQNREAYAVIAPTAVPERPEDSAPNIVSFALLTSNQPGTRVYSRTGINLSAKAQRNCAKYPSADQAQIAFLSSGGPQRDRMGLDPDGDGFACAWDPTPFRQAVKS